MSVEAQVTPVNVGQPIALAGDPEIASPNPGWLDVLVHDKAGNLYDCSSNDMRTFHGATSGDAWCTPMASPPGGVGLGVGAAGMGDQRLLVVGMQGSGAQPYEQFITPAGSTGWLPGAGAALLSAPDVAAW